MVSFQIVGSDNIPITFLICQYALVIGKCYQFGICPFKDYLNFSWLMFTVFVVHVHILHNDRQT